MKSILNWVLEQIAKVIPGFDMSDPFQQQIVLAVLIALVLYLFLRVSGLKWWLRLLYALAIGAFSFTVHYIIPGDIIGFVVAAAVVFLVASLFINTFVWIGKRKGKKEAQAELPKS